jgi:probable F420-dependent oxidoreductase
MEIRTDQLRPRRLRFIDHSTGAMAPEAADRAVVAERAGFDGFWVGGSRSDPFVSLALASERTTSVRLGTSVLIALARSPMLTATFGNDLQLVSKGRFVLGLGSQVRAHIVRRFAMPWSQPVARMAEYVAAVRAIWDCWRDGTRLCFEGDFYELTLMPPNFSPGANPFGNPPIVLGAFGPVMTELAGRVADGLFAHDFLSRRYLTEVTLPAIERGRAGAANPSAPFEITAAAIVATGATERELADEVERAREHLAFYGSTPAYRGMLELHGYGELHAELHRLSTQGRWQEMARLIPDELVSEIAIVAEPDALARSLFERYDGLADRIDMSSAAAIDWASVVADFRRISAAVAPEGV